GRPGFVDKVTRRWINRNFSGIFEDVIFVSSYYKDGRLKGEVCKEIGASVLIDDHLYHAADVVKYGVKCLLFGDYPWSESEELPPGIIRVRNWDEVLKILL